MKHYRQDGGGHLYNCSDEQHEPRLVTYWCRHKDVERLEQRKDDWKMAFAILLVALLMILFAGCAVTPAVGFDTEPQNQAPGSRAVSFSWEPPCLGPVDPCGGPWSDYVLQTSQRGGIWQFKLATPDNTAAVMLPPGTWRVRVAARTEAGELGPYSLPSEPVTIRKPDMPNIHEQETGENR